MARQYLLVLATHVFGNGRSHVGGTQGLLVRIWPIVVVLAGLIGQAAQAVEAEPGVWRTRGFQEFRAGTFGNAGENLYVSRAGVLQRIHQFDLNRDGWFDLVLCNSQDFWEQPPAYVYDDPLGNPEQRVELPSDGSLGGTVSDLNADGYDDLVLAMCENGIRSDLNAFVYFGGPEGLSENRQLCLPAPACRSVAAGDFNGDKGFDVEHPKRIRMENKEITSSQSCWLYLADLNNDDWLDLVIPMTLEDRSAVLWGGPSGFSMDRCLVLSVERAGCARAADLTGNGYLDLLLGGGLPKRGIPHDSFLYIYWNGLAGLRQDQRATLPGLNINSMGVADFNGAIAVCRHPEGVGRRRLGRSRGTEQLVHRREGRGEAC